MTEPIFRPKISPDLAPYIMGHKFFRKLFSFLLSFLLLFQGNASYLVAFAQENTGSTPSAEIVAEPSPTPTPTIEPTPEPTPIPDWIKVDDAADKTSEKVAEGKTYNFRDTQVSVKFTKITQPGFLKIQEVKVGKDTGYDITSDMPNGTFTYDLTLPNPNPSQDAKVQYSEDGQTYQEILAEKQDNIFAIKNLDHFTIFVVTSPNPVANNCSDASFPVSIGDTCYNTIQSAVDAASAGDEIHIGNGTYSESVTVDVENLTLVGESTSGVIISAGTSGTGISILFNNVTIKNVTVDQNGDGISINNVSGITIQDSTITNNTFATSGIFVQDSSDISITGNTITGNFIGIDLTGSTSDVTATGNVFGSNTDYDIANYTVSNVTATGNTWDTSSGIFAPKILDTDSSPDASGFAGQVIYDQTKPTVNAGIDKTTNTSFTQNAAVSDAYGISSYLWEEESGAVTFDDDGIEDPEISADTDGVYSIKLTATDTSGNINFDEFSLTWDQTPPSTPGSPSTTPNPTNSTPQPWDWTAGADDVSGILGYWYRVPEAGIPSTSIGNVLTWPTSFNQGIYNFFVLAEDNAGNQGPESSGSVTVDTTAPPVPVLSSPASGTFTNNSSPALTWSAVTDNLSGTKDYRVQVDNNSDFSSPEKDYYTANTFYSPSLTENTWYWRVKARDNALNWSSWSEVWNFVVDTIPPTLASKTTFSGWYNSNRTSTFTYIDINGIASGTPVMCVISTEGPVQTCSVTPNVCDAAGNCNTTLVTSNGADIDKTKPSSTPISPATGYYNAVTWPGKVAGTATDSLSEINHVDLSAFDGIGYWNSINWTGPQTWFTAAGTTSWEYVYTPDKDGEFIFYSKATDNAANIESTGTLSGVMYDTTAPTGSWVSPTANDTISGSTVLEAAASDSLSGVDSLKFQYKRNDGIDIFHDIAGTSWDTTGLALDMYTLRAIITDKAGNSTTIDRLVDVAAVVSGQASTTPSDSSAVISWTTDRLTSSRVVYDTVSHGSLGVAPNYGYASSTGTSDTSPKVLNHSVTINGLSDGTVYYYRTISEGSPVAIGDERTYKTLSKAGAPAPSGDGGGGGGAVAGVSTVFTPPTALFTAQFVPVEEILGEATQSAEIFPSPTPIPTPTPEVRGTSASTFNWWWIFIPAAFLGLIISGLLLWRRS